MIVLACTLARAQGSTAGEPQKEIRGLKITSFTENSSLQNAGAQAGDIVTHYCGVRLLSMEHLIDLRDKWEKDTAEVSLMRGSEAIVLRVPRGLLGAFMKEIVPEHPVETDAVIIEGIGRLGWGIGMENSFFGCVTLLEEKYGMKLSYNDILGLSGYGFRLHFFKGFCPSSPDATCGRDLGSEVLAALGYEFEVFAHADTAKCDKCGKDEIDCQKKQVLGKIKASIDKGFPVVAIDLIETAEWGVITGYQKGGAELFCRTYFDQTEGYEIAQKFPWVVYCINGKKQVDIKEQYKKSLLAAREMYSKKNYGPYTSGSNALKTWRKTLLDEKFYAKMDGKQLYETMHANWWIYYSLAEARDINRQYLEANADKFGIDAAVVKKLAVLMGEESDLLKKGFDHVPSPWENENASVWTPAVRKEQAGVLTELLKFEDQINGILKKIK
jgi:hypothetical protein